jgi:hypothetical protein
MALIGWTTLTVAGIALAAFAIAEEQSPPPPPTPSVNAQKQQQLRDSKENSSATSQPNVESSQSANQNSTSKDQSGEDGKKSAPDWITWFTAVIAIAAVLQFIVFCFQARYMYRGLILTKQAADAATDSVQTLNRARLVIESSKFFDVEDTSKAIFRYGYTIANKGNTPAHIFEILNCVAIIEPPLPDVPPYSSQPAATHVSIGPNQVMAFTHDEIAKSDIDMAKIADLYALGFIKYRDEFGREWITRYARQYPRKSTEPFIVQKPGYSDAT